MTFGVTALVVKRCFWKNLNEFRLFIYRSNFRTAEIRQTLILVKKALLEQTLICTLISSFVLKCRHSVLKCSRFVLKCRHLLLKCPHLFKCRRFVLTCCRFVLKCRRILHKGNLFCWNVVFCIEMRRFDWTGVVLYIMSTFVLKVIVFYLNVHKCRLLCK